MFFSIPALTLNFLDVEKAESEMLAVIDAETKFPAGKKVWCPIFLRSFHQN